jgi:hypothetical protein
MDLWYMLGALKGANMVGMWYITCYLTCHTHTHNMPCYGYKMCLGFTHLFWENNNRVLGKQGKKEWTSSFVLLTLKTIFHPILPYTCHGHLAKKIIIL